MELDKLLSKLKKESYKEEKVKEKIDMKPEWQSLWDEIEELRSLEEMYSSKAMSKRNKFWSMVEEDMNDYESVMRVNEEGNKIEILESK